MEDRIAALLVDPQRIAILIAVVGAAAAVLAAALPWLRPDPLARRIRAVGVERERIRARERERLTAPISGRRSG